MQDASDKAKQQMQSAWEQATWEVFLLGESRINIRMMSKNMETTLMGFIGMTQASCGITCPGVVGSLTRNLSLCRQARGYRLYVASSHELKQSC